MNIKQTFLKPIGKSEKDMNKFICENWLNLFPNLTFITSEFPLKGNVRSLGNNGRMDIVAYNPTSKKFVIFELKKDYDKNITDQAADYRDYVQDNFSEIYLHSTQKYEVELPKFTLINQTNVEIILIAKRFSLTQIERIKKNKENTITLIKYYWFEEDLILIDYINNDPDDIKIESENTKKINEIKNIISQDPEMFEINRFFGLREESKIAFIIFLNLLKSNGTVELGFSQTKIAVKINGATFSAISSGGKGGRKTILQINTNFDASSLPNLVIDDRYRGEGVKQKGSLGLERFEVFLRNEEEVKDFYDFIKVNL
jgi:hypothetical protein